MNIERKTMSVVEAGELLGLGRSAAYSSARRGEIPTLKFGRKLVVPIALFQRMLGEEPT
jgi:excisionase family DNA binding protein